MTSSPNPSDLSILQVERNQGYGNWPLPSERDQEIAELIDRLQANDFEDAHRLIEPQHAQVLSAFAERMASLAVRRHSPEDLRKGLFALALAGSVSRDIREGILVMALLWRSAEILGLDPAREFMEAGELVGGPGGEHLISFTTRSPRNRSLQVMGYVEDMDEGGFRYKRTW